MLKELGGYSMLVAIIGDIVGSRFEWNNLKSKEFELFTNMRCHPTDGWNKTVFGRWQRKKQPYGRTIICLRNMG